MVNIVAFEAWTDEWNPKRTTGKWKTYPDYGKAKTGFIALQDHGNKAYYKNIRIKELYQSSYFKRKGSITRLLFLS